MILEEELKAYEALGKECNSSTILELVDEVRRLQAMNTELAFQVRERDRACEAARLLSENNYQAMRFEEKRLIETQVERSDLRYRIAAAMGIIESYGGIDGEHHKVWIIDQVVRALKREMYAEWVNERNAPDEQGIEYTPWDVGIAP